MNGNANIGNIGRLFAALWRLIRGEDQRGRKVRWLVAQLRPYRGRVSLMFVGLLAATAAGLAPPYLAGKAIDSGIQTGDIVEFMAVALGQKKTRFSGSFDPPCFFAMM